MKRYAIVFEESAQSNVRESYDWGCRNWGEKQAQLWVRELRTAIIKQLSLLPKGFPLAPEDDEFSEEIRQMLGPLSCPVYYQTAQSSRAPRQRSLHWW